MTILVTGATGNIGRHLVARLLAAGVKVRALSRRPGNETTLPDGVDVVLGDLADPESLGPAFAGVDRMFLFPVAATADAVAKLAAASGVKHAVVLSSDAVTDGTDTEYHLPVEQAVEKSGMDWTHLRPGEFALNKLTTWGHSIRTESVVRSAYPTARGVPVHEADIADMAAAALLHPGHAGAVYTVTGPRSMTPAEQVEELSAGLRRPLAFVAVTPEEARADLVGQGFPAHIADYLLSFQRGWVDDPPAVSPDVPRVLGRPARSLAQWAADHAGDFS
jgi:uncharacterized protein YbjT (DUF2867 family)